MKEHNILEKLWKEVVLEIIEAMYKSNDPIAQGQIISDILFTAVTPLLDDKDAEVAHWMTKEAVTCKKAATLQAENITLEQRVEKLVEHRRRILMFVKFYAKGGNDNGERAKLCIIANKEFLND